jgi:hypothetical protein
LPKPVLAPVTATTVPSRSIPFMRGPYMAYKPMTSGTRGRTFEMRRFVALLS